MKRANDQTGAVLAPVVVMRTFGFLLALSGFSVLASAAQCDPSVVSVSAADGHLALVNNSGKPIVAYVLVDGNERSASGAPRTYTGNFTAANGVAPGSSVVFGSAQSADQVSIDFVRFDDGSSCGNGTTREAKQAGAH